MYFCDNLRINKLKKLLQNLHVTDSDDFPKKGQTKCLSNKKTLNKISKKTVFGRENMRLKNTWENILDMWRFSEFRIQNLEFGI